MYWARSWSVSFLNGKVVLFWLAVVGEAAVALMGVTVILGVMGFGGVQGLKRNAWVALVRELVLMSRSCGILGCTTCAKSSGLFMCKGSVLKCSLIEAEAGSAIHAGILGSRGSPQVH